MKKTILLSLVMMMFFLMTSAFRSYATDSSKVKTTDSAYIKLTPQQYEDLVRAKIEKEAENDNGRTIVIGDRHGIGHISPFIFVILIIVVISVSKHFRQKRMQELHMKYLEAGKEIPADMSKIFREYRNNPMRRAIVLIMVGFGIMVSMYFVVPNDAPNIWTIGLIPLFVGLGFLIVHFFEKKS
jgi:hypothetical protein